MATKTETKPVETKSRLRSQLRPQLRKGALAYVGLYGLAYDRFQMRRAQAKTVTENLFGELAEQGETTVQQAEVLLKKAQKGVWKNYGEAAGKFQEALPVKIKTRVETLEDELAKLRGTYERLQKTAKAEASAKTTTKKKAAVKKQAAKKAAPAPEPAPVAVKAPVATPAPTPAPTPTSKAPEAVTPRHIPYFLDVKRYDPLANEDFVRKIVNHCGIALRSEDARYVACSDESERVTVRESWLKRKLGLTELDADLDKKVLAVCDLMQRDQKKNRVTFYYLLAKKERLLETL